ncbi:hypothetical protein EDC04DRAFT_2602514 [Pisolithus marmoratus]|nr:hypothetical protein EDC04DRAFT_2602514 [Pisolithus marmoratus]
MADLETVGYLASCNTPLYLHAFPRREHTFDHHPVSVQGPFMADTAAAAPYATALLGPVVVSLVLAGVLYGCALVQTHVYYKLFPADDWRLRALRHVYLPNRIKVAFEMAFQTVQLTLLFVGVWETVMVFYSHTEMTSALVDILIVGMIFGGPSAFCVQAFFIFRLHSFSQRKPLPILCFILITIQLVFTLTFGAVSSRAATSDVSGLQKWQGFIVSALSISICADTIIAASMSYYLRGSRTGHHRTSRLIDRMVVYILGKTHRHYNTTTSAESSASITALLAGITFYATPNTCMTFQLFCDLFSLPTSIVVWIALCIIEAGLYANSLLAALNARALLTRVPSNPRPTDVTEERR